MQQPEAVVLALQPGRNFPRQRHMGTKKAWQDAKAVRRKVADQQGKCGPIIDLVPAGTDTASDRPDPMDVWGNVREAVQDVGESTGQRIGCVGKAQVCAGRDPAELLEALGHQIRNSIILGGREEKASHGIRCVPVRGADSPLRPRDVPSNKRARGDAMGGTGKPPLSGSVADASRQGIFQHVPG